MNKICKTLKKMVGHPPQHVKVRSVTTNEEGGVHSAYDPTAHIVP